MTKHQQPIGHLHVQGKLTRICKNRTNLAWAKSIPRTTDWFIMGWQQSSVYVANKYKFNQIPNINISLSQQCKHINQRTCICMSRMPFKAFHFHRVNIVCIVSAHSPNVIPASGLNDHLVNLIAGKIVWLKRIWSQRCEGYLIRLWVTRGVPYTIFQITYMAPIGSGGM